MAYVVEYDSERGRLFLSKDKKKFVVTVSNAAKFKHKDDAKYYGYKIANKSVLQIYGIHILDGY